MCLMRTAIRESNKLLPLRSTDYADGKHSRIIFKHPKEEKRLAGAPVNSKRKQISELCFVSNRDPSKYFSFLIKVLCYFYFISVFPTH